WWSAVQRPYIEKIKEFSKTLTIPAQLKEVKDIVQHMAKRKAAGPDKIPVELVKELPDTTLQMLVDVINCTLKTHKMLDEWRLSNIWTIYKKGDPCNPNNYRPIALANVFYKVYSLLLTRRLNRVLEKSQMLQQAQGGFQKGRGCTNKLLLLRSIIEDAKIHSK